MTDLSNGYGLHAIEWLWDNLDTASRICLACSCKEFYGVVSKQWKHLVIPDWIPINDENLLPILICCQNIETLTINFPHNAEEQKDSDALILKLLQQYEEINQRMLLQNKQNQNQNNDNDNKDNMDVKQNDNNAQMNQKQDKKKKKKYRIKYPSQAINPSYLPHLKKLNKIDFKSCGYNSYSTFITGFITHLSKFITLSHLCLPQLFTIRHNCISILDIHQLQIGFDGMNVHLGADLIGISHLKKQMPKINTIYCDELYLFIGEDIYIKHDKSGKQYWIAMRKWCLDVNIKIYFKVKSLTIMLMPRGQKKKKPPLIYENWDNIKDWMQDRLGDFIQNVDDINNDFDDVNSDLDDINDID